MTDQIHRLTRFKTYSLAFLFLVLGGLCIVAFFADINNTTRVALTEVKGKLKDYTFVNNQSGRNWHYLWLREHKALFECDEYRFFGNEVASFARQDQPVALFIESDDFHLLNNADASIQLRGLSIGNQVLFEKDDTADSGLGSLYLLAAFGFVFLAMLIFIVQRWLVKF